jgi:hypothetical protein
MKPESVEAAIKVARRLIANYQMQQGNHNLPSSSYKIHISPKTQEELLALVAVLSLNEIKIDTIDIDAPFITSRMQQSTTVSNILRELNYTLERCQSDAIKAYNKICNPDNTYNKDELSSFSSIEESWKTLHFENFDIKRLKKKWNTVLIGEKVEDWTAHLKEILNNLDPNTTQALRSDVLSLYLYLEKAQKVLTATQKWLHTFEITQSKIPLNRSILEAKKAQWQEQWNDSETGGWSVILSDSSEFLEYLTKLKVAITQKG